MLITTPAPGGDAVDARLATLMPLTPAPGAGAVDARLATLMPLTPAPGGGAVESHSWTAKYYLIHSRDGELSVIFIKVAFGVSVIFIKGAVG